MASAEAQQALVPGLKQDVQDIRNEYDDLYSGWNQRLIDALTVIYIAVLIDIVPTWTVV